MSSATHNQTRDALNEIASIGAFVGIDLIVNGASWTAISHEGRAMLAPIAK